MKRPILVITLLTIPLLLHADEFVYDAEVISSEPFTTKRVSDRMPAHCTAGKPNASFADVIAWDVECELPQEITVRGYRVTYELEGERFVAFSDEAPGSTIPVRISLD